MKLAQQYSDLLALVPTVVRFTEEDAVDLRSETKLTGAAGQATRLRNKRQRGNAQRKEETRNCRVYPSSSSESSRFRSKEKTSTNKHKKASSEIQ